MCCVCMYVCMYVDRKYGKCGKYCIITKGIIKSMYSFKAEGVEVLSYISFMGVCRCEGYGFQVVWSVIGYRSQRGLV